MGQWLDAALGLASKATIALDMNYLTNYPSAGFDITSL
jgi:hypothetical protein